MKPVAEEFTYQERVYAWVASRDALEGVLIYENGLPVSFLSASDRLDPAAGQAIVTRLVTESGAFSIGPLLRGRFPQMGHQGAASALNLSVMEMRARALVRRNAARISGEVPEDATPLALTAPARKAAAPDLKIVKAAPDAAPSLIPPPAGEEEAPVPEIPKTAPSLIPPPEIAAPETAPQEVALVSMSCTLRDDPSDETLLALAAVAGPANVRFSAQREIREDLRVRTRRKLEVMCVMGTVREVLACLSERGVTSGIKIRTF